MANWPCDSCLNHPRCIYITNYATGGMFCPGFEKSINNNSPRKEDLVNDLWNNDYTPLDSDMNPRNYKDACEEWGRSKEVEHKEMHDHIMAMPDDKTADLVKKAVAALAFFEVSASKSMRVLKLAERTFYRYFRGK